MHHYDVRTCLHCLATPFHIECLESHYDQVHPEPQQARKEKEKAEEEEILQQEADDACAQWVDQMTNLSKIAMPLGRRITSVVVALISVALAVEPFWSPTVDDVPVSLLQ